MAKQIRLKDKIEIIESCGECPVLCPGCGDGFQCNAAPVCNLGAFNGNLKGPDMYMSTPEVIPNNCPLEDEVE